MSNIPCKTHKYVRLFLSWNYRWRSESHRLRSLGEHAFHEATTPFPPRIQNVAITLESSLLFSSSHFSHPSDKHGKLFTILGFCFPPSFYV